jgi:hypothetical protein
MVAGALGLYSCMMIKDYLYDSTLVIANALKKFTWEN